MSHEIYRIVDFKHMEPFTMWIKFDDETERVIDFRPVLEGSIYGPLQDESVFNQAELNPERHTLVWPNGADFDPETLHDWPTYAEKMKRMAKQWATMTEKAAAT